MLAALSEQDMRREKSFYNEFSFVTHMTEMTHTQPQPLYVLEKHILLDSCWHEMYLQWLEKGPNCQSKKLFRQSSWEDVFVKLIDLLTQIVKLSTHTCQ